MNEERYIEWEPIITTEAGDRVMNENLRKDQPSRHFMRFGGAIIGVSIKRTI